jgi:hypothetical protein
LRGSIYNGGGDGGSKIITTLDTTIVGVSLFEEHACVEAQGGIYDVNLVDGGVVLLTASVPTFGGFPPVQTAANEYGCYWPGDGRPQFEPWGGGQITTFAAVPPTGDLYNFVRLAADSTGLFSLFFDGPGLDLPGDGGGPFYQLPDAGEVTGLACSSGTELVSNFTSLAWISSDSVGVLMVSKH